MCTNIILFFSLALDETYDVLKISFATMNIALGLQTGLDIFHFVVYFTMMTCPIVQPITLLLPTRVKLGWAVTIIYHLHKNHMDTNLIAGKD